MQHENSTKRFHSPLIVTGEEKETIMTDNNYDYRYVNKQLRLQVCKQEITITGVYTRNYDYRYVDKI